MIVVGSGVCSPVLEPLLIPFNDDLAQLCRRLPDRFAGLAALPYADMGRAVAEYRRARTQLGLAGDILPVNGFLSLATAETFRPNFAAARDLGGQLFIDRHKDVWGKRDEDRF